MENTTKLCIYRNCTNEVAAISEFQFCESCRILQQRDLMAMVLDPESPFNRVAMQKNCDQLFTVMTKDEVLHRMSQIEFVYLAFSTQRLRFQIEDKGKRVKQTLAEQVTAARGNQTEIDNARNILTPKQKAVKKAAKKKDSVLMRQMRALGCNDDCAKFASCPHRAAAERIFNDTTLAF